MANEPGLRAEKEDLDAVKAWFDALSGHVQKVDYEGARYLFDNDLLIFGTFQDFVVGQPESERQQWRNVWGTIEGFQFRIADVRALVSPDRLFATGLGIWDSTGFTEDGQEFDRKGRATVTLERKSVGEPFVATHTHMSLFRGTPDRSYGRKPKAA